MVPAKVTMAAEDECHRSCVNTALSNVSFNSKVMEKEKYEHIVSFLKGDTSSNPRHSLSKLRWTVKQKKYRLLTFSCLNLKGVLCTPSKKKIIHLDMTSDQQDSDLNNSVQKSGTGLNPNADAFFYKAVTPSVDKGWEPGEEFLTNGDVKQGEVGGGFSPGDSPVSESPPAPIVDVPPEFIPADGLVGGPAAVSMVVGAEAAASVVVEEGAVVPEQALDLSMASVDMVVPPVSTSPSPLANGYGSGPDSQEAGAQAPETNTVPSSPAEVRRLLLAQLEYYFSRVNLVQDHYLQSQMDGDQYVPILTIANFNQVVKLTRDYDLIVEILRSSKLVQVDEKGTKVRPKHNRSVLMLREIPETTMKSEVEELFNSEHCPKLVSCEFAHNGYWYITFNTDEEARDAYVYLRQFEVKFKEKPVLARIKAKPLVRAGGSAQFPPNKNPSRQQQDPAVSFMRQQQQPAQYPVLTPMSQFVNQQQVPQAVQQFQLYNFPAMMPGWGAPSSPATTFLDPGAMLAMNGYQATSIKPSTNHSRNMYPVRNNNNRGAPRPHHRPQSVSSDKGLDTRPMDRPHTGNNSSSGVSSTRASPRNNNSSSNQHTSDLHTQPPPFARSRSDGSSTTGGGGGGGGGSNGHFGSQLHGGAVSAAAPTPLVPEESLPHHHSHIPAQALPTSKPDAISNASSIQKRPGNFNRRSRRNEEGAKNPRSNPGHGGKDGKPHEPHFELEATSFPPLPGSTSNSSSSDAHEGNKLSDVVKGTARPHSRYEEKMKASPVPSGSGPTAAPAAAVITPAPSPATAAAAATPVSSVAESSPAPQPSASNTASALTAASVVSAVPASSSASAAAKETEVSDGLSTASQSAAAVSTTTPASATAAEPSAHPSKTSRTSGHPATSAAKPAVEATVVSKQVTVSTTPAKQTPAPSPGLSLVLGPAADTAPAKLSYAQMVARKQQAEIAARQMNAEEGANSQATAAATASAAARPATQSTLREQTQASASVPAAAPPKSASASARPAKETPRKDFEQKEQRFQGGRRAKENRDSRQPRFDRRRSDRDVKVPAK